MDHLIVKIALKCGNVLRTSYATALHLWEIGSINDLQITDLAKQAQHVAKLETAAINLDARFCVTGSDSHRIAAIDAENAYIAAIS